MNPYYTYENMHLWNGEAWRDKLSSIHPLVTWIGAHEEIGVSRSVKLPCGPVEDPKSLACYQLKTGSVDDPGVIQFWQDKGIRYKSLEMGGMFWIPMVPGSAFATPKKQLPVLMVLHHEDHGDPYWAMRTLEYYRKYNELAAEQGIIVLYVVTDNKPDVDRMYVNVLQEALVLFPCDVDRIYLDISVVRRVGQRLGDVEGFLYRDEQGVILKDPEPAVKQLGDIPVIPISKRWENRDSFTRDSVIGDRVSDATYNRERLIHTATGQKMMEAIAFEHQYSDASDTELRDYWAKFGLLYESHEKNGERWIVLATRSTSEHPEEKLPVLLVMQEVSRSNSHSAVAAFGAFFEYCRIAANGEVILLFFALESPEDNDLLYDILEDAVERYPIDKSRAYITGHSHNGHFSMEFVRRHPGAIAGVATLGNFPGFYAPEWCYDAVKVSDDKIQLMSRTDMPVINISGCCEMRSMFPLHSDAKNMRSEQATGGYAATFACRANSWQRRLQASRCPMKSLEEIAATSQSLDKVTRILGIPGDKSETIYIDGIEHYIADIKNKDGKYHLRIVGIENMPHMTTPFMQTLAWSFLRRFARDKKSGQIIELI